MQIPFRTAFYGPYDSRDNPNKRLEFRSLRINLPTSLRKQTKRAGISGSRLLSTPRDCN